MGTPRAIRHAWLDRSAFDSFLGVYGSQCDASRLIIPHARLLLEIVSKERLRKVHRQLIDGALRGMSAVGVASRARVEARGEKPLKPLLSRQNTLSHHGLEHAKSDVDTICMRSTWPIRHFLLHGSCALALHSSKAKKRSVPFPAQRHCYDLSRRIRGILGGPQSKRRLDCILYAPITATCSVSCKLLRNRKQLTMW